MMNAKHISRLAGSCLPSQPILADWSLFAGVIQDQTGPGERSRISAGVKGPWLPILDS